MTMSRQEAWIRSKKEQTGFSFLFSFSTVIATGFLNAFFHFLFLHFFLFFFLPTVKFLHSFAMFTCIVLPFLSHYIITRPRRLLSFAKKTRTLLPLSYFLFLLLSVSAFYNEEKPVKVILLEL